MDTVQLYSSKYSWFTYEAMHGIVRLMLIHSHVGDVLAQDEDTMELFEKCLRQ